jgi:hypothetical protein
MSHSKARISSLEVAFDDDVPQPVIDEARDAAEAAFCKVVRRYYPAGPLDPAAPLPVTPCEWGSHDGRVCPRLADYYLMIFQLGSSNPDDPAVTQNLCPEHTQEAIGIWGSAPIILQRLPSAARM